MSSFAVDVGVAFRRGSMRGELSQLFSMGISRDRLMSTIGNAIDDAIISHRASFLERRLRLSGPDAPGNIPAIQIERSPSDPKERWVDGTPEYSFGIFGLHKLFPEARFIHIVRDCDQVAHSMYHFDRIANFKIVSSLAEGYDRWQRYVRAVLDAEGAYGSSVMLRVFYRDLVKRSEDCLRRILDFCGEAFAPECLEPLTIKINSSRVESYTVPGDLVDDLTIIGAQELWKKLGNDDNLPAISNPAAADWLERQFEERIEYVFDSEGRNTSLHDALKNVDRELQQRTDWALELSREITQRDNVVLGLQAELLEQTNWAKRLDAATARKDALILELQGTCRERTNWAFGLQAELDQKAVIVADLQSKCAAQTRDLAMLRQQVKEKHAALKTLQKKLQSRKNWIVAPFKWFARKLASALRGRRRRPAI